MIFSKPVAYASLASTASAFVALTNPVPFMYDGEGIANMPLKSNAADFPCHGVSYTVDETNVYEAGSVQELSFQGTAVHGGGSCQISITNDLKPTKDSVWRVIKSIEGGCPAQGVANNLETTSGNVMMEPVPFGYNFTVPDVSAGQYTLAWTWFNKNGNREMYMNCAPLEVTGGSGSVAIDTLPEMFVANIGNECTTVEGTDVLFPDPGEAVEQLNGATTAFQAPQGTACALPPSVEDLPIFDPVETPAPARPTDEPEIVRYLRPHAPLQDGVTEGIRFPPGGSCDDEGMHNCADGQLLQVCEKINDAGDLAWIGTILYERICAVGLGYDLITIPNPEYSDDPAPGTPVTIIDTTPTPIQDPITNVPTLIVDTFVDIPGTPVTAIEITPTPISGPASGVPTIAPHNPDAPVEGQVENPPPGGKCSFLGNGEPRLMGVSWSVEYDDDSSCPVELEGISNCIGSRYFQRCEKSRWVLRAVGRGLECKVGMAKEVVTVPWVLRGPPIISPGTGLTPPPPPYCL